MEKSKRFFILPAIAAISAGIIPMITSCGSGLRRGAIEVTDSNFNVEYYEDYEGYLVTDYKGDADTLELPNEVRDENGEYKPIKGIHDYAFSKREKLKEVRLSANMEYVGPHAFAESQIEKVVVNAGVREFPVSSLAEAPISLATYEGCQYLPGPNGDYYYLVSYLGNGDPKIHDNCHAIAENVFEKASTVYCPKNCKVEILDDSCLKGKTLAVSGSSGALVSFPNIEYLGANCLNKTKKIESITIGKNAKKLPSSSLAGCSATTIVVPETIKSMAPGCFDGCSKLTSLTVPFSDPGTAEMTDVTTWNDGGGFKCFFGKTMVSSVTTWNIPSTLKTIVVTGVKGEDGKILGERHLKGCFKGFEATSIKVPANTNFLEQDFANSYIESYPIGDQCESIGLEAFYGCQSSKLTTLRIPDGVKKIENRAFAKTPYLEKVYIPKSVKTMGAWVFADSNAEAADNLTIYCEAESEPSEIDWDAMWNDKGTGKSKYKTVWGATMPR